MPYPESACPIKLTIIVVWADLLSGLNKKVNGIFGPALINN